MSAMDINGATQAPRPAPAQAAARENPVAAAQQRPVPEPPEQSAPPPRASGTDPRGMIVNSYA